MTLLMEPYWARYGSTDQFAMAWLSRPHVIVNEWDDGFCWQLKKKTEKEQRFAARRVHFWRYTALAACEECGRRVRPIGGLRGLITHTEQWRCIGAAMWRSGEWRDAYQSKEVCVRCFNKLRWRRIEANHSLEIQREISNIKREMKNVRDQNNGTASPVSCGHAGRDQERPHGHREGVSDHEDGRSN